MKVKEAIEAARGNDDLWQKLDAAIADVSKPPRPPDTFTKEELMKQRGVTRHVAARMLQQLLTAGKIRRLGVGNQTYYEMVKS